MITSFLAAGINARRGLSCFRLFILLVLLTGFPVVAAQVSYAQDEYYEEEYYEEEYYEEEYYEEEYYEEESYEEEYYEEEYYEEESYEEEYYEEEYYEDDSYDDEYYEDDYYEDSSSDYDESYDDSSYDSSDEYYSEDDYFEDDDAYTEDYDAYEGEFTDEQYSEEYESVDDAYYDEQYSDGGVEEYDEYVDEFTEVEEYEVVEEYEYTEEVTTSDPYSDSARAQPEYQDDVTYEEVYESFTVDQQQYTEEVIIEGQSAAPATTPSTRVRTETPAPAATNSVPPAGTMAAPRHPSTPSSPTNSTPSRTQSNSTAASSARPKPPAATPRPAPSQKARSSGMPSQEEVLRDVVANLEVWQEMYANQNAVNPVELGKMCLRAKMANCDRFVMTGLIAFKVTREGTPLKPLTAEQLAGFRDYLARSAPRCKPPKSCLAAEVRSEQNIDALLTLFRNDPSLDFETIYKKTEARYPNAPKMCVISQVYRLHWFTEAARKANQSGTGPAYLQTMNDWVNRKTKELWPNGWKPELDIVRGGQNFSIANKAEYLARYCGADVWK